MALLLPVLMNTIKYIKIIANQVYSKDFDYAFSQSKISIHFLMNIIQKII